MRSYSVNKMRHHRQRNESVVKDIAKGLTRQHIGVGGRQTENFNDENLQVPDCFRVALHSH